MVRNQALISSLLFKASSIAIFVMVVSAPFSAVNVASAEVAGEGFGRENSQNQGWNNNQSEENECHVSHEHFGNNENDSNFNNNWHWHSSEHQCADEEHADTCPNIEGFQWAVPEGYQLIDGACVIPVTCTETQHIVADLCVDNATTTPPVICGEAQHVVGTICVDNATTTPPVVCSDTQHIVNNACLDNATSTPAIADESTGDNNGNGSGNAGGNVGGNGPIAGSLPVGGIGPQIGGSVLGASTSTVSCAVRFNTSIMRKDLAQNDVAEVKNLQSFLNDFQKAGLEVNGTYDAATIAAVKAFQIAHKKEVLDRWPTTATGHFYLSTRWMANIENCRMQGIELELPFPALIPFVK
jgi:hypothetical protein